MLRLHHAVGDPVKSIALEGRLTAPWIAELRDTVATVRGSGALRLNLTGLSFADQEGAALLHSLRADGVELIGASPFIATLLAHRPQLD